MIEDEGDADDVLTVAIALPMVLGAAFIEVYVSPHILRALIGHLA